MLNFFYNKKVKYIFLILAIILIMTSFGIFWPQDQVSAQTAGSGVGNFLASLIGNFLYWIVQLLANLLVAIIQILVSVAKFNNFIGSTAVEKGWVIVRDVCNMLFIAILLVIAFGTIFKWETYRYNKLLGRLILMAFLINFSKFICGFFIDFAQVITLTFVNAFANVAAGNFINGLGLGEMLSLRAELGAEVDFSGVVGALILAILLLTIAVVVIAVTALVFLMRILILWLLVVLSPLAFFLRAWPGSGERFSSQWWQNFGKYLFIGPVLAFFIWLTLSIISTSGGDLLTQEGFVRPGTIESSLGQGSGSSVVAIGGAQAEKFGAAITNISRSDMLLSYIIAISLLIGSLMMTRQMGVMGANIASTALGKIQGGLTRVATLGAAAIGGGVVGAGLVAGRRKIGGAARFGLGRGRDVLARKIFHERPRLRWMTPTYWRGAMQRGERLKEWALRETGGSGEYFAEKFFKGKQAAIPRDELAWMANASQIRGDYESEFKAAGMSRHKMMEMFLRARSTEGAEGVRHKIAFLPHTTSKGNFDDDWEALISSVYTKEFAEEHGMDYDIMRDYSDVSGRIAAMEFLGLNAEKFDPATILEKKIEAGIKTGEIKDQKILENKAHIMAEEYDKLLDDDKELIEKYEHQASREAKDNAVKRANEDERKKLQALANMGIEARDSGHYEQLFALTDEKTGRSYMINPMEAYEEAAGEAGKVGTRRYIGLINPYEILPKFWDPKKEDFRFSTDVDTQTRWQRKFFKEQITSEQLRDMHHMQKRITFQTLGVVNKVGKQDANFDIKGGFYDARDQFGNEEEAQRQIKENAYDELMEEVRKKGTEKGLTGKALDEYSAAEWQIGKGRFEDNVKKMLDQGRGKGLEGDELMKFVKNKRRGESRERAGKMRKVNQIGFDAFYKIAFYGEGREPRPTPFSDAWNGLGQAFTDEVADDVDTPQKIKDRSDRKRKEVQAKYSGKELIDNEERINREEQSAMEALGAVKAKKKKKMVDISESQQNATREKISAQGEKFWLSEDFRNNPEKYYDQEQFEYNEKVLGALERQENVDKLSGMSAAQAAGEKGESASLALNFDDKRLKVLGLTGAGQELEAEQKDKAIDKIAGIYTEQMMADNEQKADKDKLSEDEILDMTNQFRDNLKNASSLRLVNKNRKGVDVRHILKHEQFHDQISKLLPDDKLEEMWHTMSAEVQDKIKDQLKAMGYAVDQMDTTQLMHEYLAEGMTNETRYEMPGGLNLEKEHLGAMKEAGFKVKELEDSPEIKDVVSRFELGKLGTKAKIGAAGRATVNLFKSPFDSLADKWRSRQQGRRDERAKKEADALRDQVEEMLKQGKITDFDEEADNLALAWQDARQQRIRKEDEYKKKKAQRERNTNIYNNQITQYEEEARKAAGQGQVSEASRLRSLANDTRQKGLTEDKALESFVKEINEAKVKEAEAWKTAQDAVDKSSDTKKDIEALLHRREEAAYSGKEGYEKHLSLSIDKGAEKFGGLEKYKEELQKNISLVAGQVKLKTGPVEFDMRASIHGWKQELKMVESRLSKEKVEMKVTHEVEKPEKVEIPAEIEPHLETEDAQKAVENLEATEQKVNRAEQAAGEAGIDPELFSSLAGEINDGFSKLADEISKYSKIMEHLGKPDASKDFVKNAIEPLTKELSGIRPGTHTTREDQYPLIYEFRRLIKALKEKSVETAKKVPSPPPTKEKPEKTEQAPASKKKKKPLEDLEI